MYKKVHIDNVEFQTGSSQLSLIAGPCQLESYDQAVLIANTLKDVCKELQIGYVFKASYDKANRSSYKSIRGVGLKKGLEMLHSIKKECEVPVISDIHCINHIDEAAQVLDALQIPAFLCRQTDLIVESGRTGLPVNIKKGQFMAPHDMENAIEKVTQLGNEKVIITERGTSFGYNNLVVDMRAMVIMSDFGYPIVFDGTHSAQLPGGQGTSSGGQRKMVPYLCQSAVATGRTSGLFLEIHPEPDKSPSDGPNMLALENIKETLKRIQNIYINSI